jgi:hypothetical protein
MRDAYNVFDDKEALAGIISEVSYKGVFTFEY